MFSHHRFSFSLVLLLLSQWWTPPLRLQYSACSTFLMMCDVPSMAGFCRESIECCPGIVSTYFKPLLTIPVAPVITGMTKHFILYIRWNFVLRFLYFNLFSVSFCIAFLSDSIVTAVSKQIMSLFLTIMSDLFARTSLSVCTPWFHNTVTPSCSVTDLSMPEYQISVVSVPNFLRIEKCRCVHTLSLRIMYSFLTRVGYPDVRLWTVCSYSF
jgi:hypothetical protein